MRQVIIHKQENGIVAIEYPTEEALAMLTLQEIARRVVPTGRPFKIIDVADLPSDYSQRNQWTVDEADLTDGVGA